MSSVRFSSTPPTIESIVARIEANAGVPANARAGYIELPGYPRRAVECQVKGDQVRVFWMSNGGWAERYGAAITLAALVDLGGTSGEALPPNAREPWARIRRRRFALGARDLVFGALAVIAMPFVLVFMLLLNLLYLISGKSAQRRSP